MDCLVSLDPIGARNDTLNSRSHVHIHTHARKIVKKEKKQEINGQICAMECGNFLLEKKKKTQNYLPDDSTKVEVFQEQTD